MSAGKSIPVPPPNTKNIALGIILCVYILFGLYTHQIFVHTNPDYDFHFYETALTKALSGADPYDLRKIGPAFLYPSPSLFIIEAFDVFSNPTVRFYLFLAVNLIVLLFMIRQISAHFGYSLRDVWFWFPLTFFFAPVLACLRAGQINLITEFGIVLFFISVLPWLSALGLVLAIITKVTPVAFLFYSFIRKDVRTILYSLIILTTVIFAAGLRYGFATYPTFFDVFRDLLKIYGITQNSQSFTSKVWMVFQPTFAPPIFHRLFLLYLGILVLGSGVLAFKTKDTIPLFVVLGLAITVSPNVMWYHHYVFLLPPLLIWMAWQKLENKLVLWIITGLLIVQIDYYFLTTGLLIHLFVQLSVLRIVYQQYSKLQMSESLRSISTV